MTSPRQKKVALVIGAGGSFDFGLPIGRDLKTKIASLLDIGFKDGYRQSSGDYVISEALRIASQQLGGRGSVNDFLPAARHIRDAMPQAILIDNFIDCVQDTPHIALCGKLAICKAILDAEKRSKLHLTRDETGINFSTTEPSWLNPFVQILTENCTPDMLEDRLRSLTIVTFNYDRCIEHYLYHWLQNYYQFSTSKAAELISLIEIYHPYGSVGSLPFQRKPLSISLGGEPQPQMLLDLSNQIRTFTEQSESLASELSNARRDLASAATIIFIGFAFHEQNMRLICPYVGSLRTVDRAFATALNFSNSDTDLITQDIATGLRLDPKNVVVRNELNGHGLFGEYSRSLRWPKP